MSAENLLPGCAAAATARHTGTHTPFAPEHKPLVPLGALLLAASVSSWAQTPPEATLSTVTVKEKAEVQSKDTVLTRKTTIGKGAPNKEGGHDVHGAPLGAAEIAAALLTLFGTLHALRISHGDLKATNLLWHDGQVVLIDLDAMTQHRSSRTHAQAWQRDRARFLRNWPAGSPLVRWLDARLPLP